MTEPPDAPQPDDPSPEDPTSEALTPEDPTPEAPASAPRGERRLAAVLFADVAGYTELSSHDEDLALSMIQAFQGISRKLVGEKGGRVVKFLGDGMLAEFSSLDAAVNAAHALQNSFPYLEEVKKSKVSLRVGVHLGDIAFSEDGDVYGSGVNVASRIECHAPLAGVVVSDSAYQQLRHRRHYEFSSIGEKDLKGVPDPMELYVVLLAGQDPPAPALRVPTRDRRLSNVKRRSRKPWIAVGVALVASAAAVAMDLGGIQAQANQFLEGIGLPAVFTRGVFAQSPGYRAIEGGAAIDSDISVGFSGLINRATATSSSVQLLGPGGVLVPTEISASVDGLAVDITPLSPLAYATRYRVVLTGALRSSSGGEIRPPRGPGSSEDLLSFLTQPVPPDPPVLASTEPADGSTGADGAEPVVVTFSKPMNPLTLDSTTVMLITAGGAQLAVGLTCCGDDDGTLRVDRSRALDDRSDPGIGRLPDHRVHRRGQGGPCTDSGPSGFRGGCPPDRDFRHVPRIHRDHTHLRCRPDAVSCAEPHYEGCRDTVRNYHYRFHLGGEGLRRQRRGRPRSSRELSGNRRGGSHLGNPSARCGCCDPCAVRRRLQC
jgi:class 3 adenylate cyclase